MNAPRPLLFSDLVPFDTEKHRTLRLPTERKSFAFAANAPLLPLTFAEVAPALRHFPVVLVAEGNTVALVGLMGLGGDKSGGNRFVDANGNWRTGAYIPAYVRGYPFIAIRPSETAEPVLALDPKAADFMRPGAQLLIGADGKPSEQLKGIMAFQGEYRQLAERTQRMTQALRDAGVLEEGKLQLQANDPKADPVAVGGFLVVSEAKLRGLSTDALKTLMDADALGLAYAQLLSMGSLGNVFAQAPVTAPQEVQPEKQAEKQASKRSKKKAE